MIFKSLKYTQGSEKYALTFPDEKIVHLGNGKSVNSSGNQVLEIVESLLMRDYSGYYNKLDTQASTSGFEASPFTGKAILSFTNGATITGDSKTGNVDIKGDLPKVHCIRYTNGGAFRSFGNVEDADFSDMLSTDMREYNDRISGTNWLKIVKLTNNVFRGIYGSDNVVQLETTPLGFTIKYLYDVKPVQSVFLLLAECMLTPRDYKRVVLLPPLDIFSDGTINKDSKDILTSRLIQAISMLKGTQLVLYSGSDLPHEKTTNVRLIR